MDLPHPQALLFDLDGVLADVSGSYRASILRTAASYGVVVTPHDIDALKARGGANNDWDVTRRLMQARGVDVPLSEVTARFEAFYQGTDSAPGLRLTERLLPQLTWLSSLAARFPLAVVTGRTRKDAHRFLSDSALAPLVQVVICAEDGPLKPDPWPVRTAMERLGVTQAWMVGDTPDDIRAATTAGAVPFGIVAPQEDVAFATGVLLGAGAVRVLTHLAELDAWLP